METKKPKENKENRIKGYIIFFLSVLTVLLAVVSIVAAHFYQGQLNQNEYMVAVNKATKQQLDVMEALERKANAELAKEKQAKIIVETNYKELKSQFQQHSTFMDASINKAVAKMESSMKKLEQQNRIRVDANNQLVSIYRDSLTSRRASDRQPQRLKVINYKDKRGWFEMSGTMQDTALTFNPSFLSKYEINFDKQTTSTGFLGLRKRDTYTIKVKDKNPYNRTGQIEKVIKEQDAIKYGSEPYQRERKRINSRPKF